MTLFDAIIYQAMLLWEIVFHINLSHKINYWLFRKLFWGVSNAIGEKYFYWKTWELSFIFLTKLWAFYIDVVSWPLFQRKAKKKILCSALTTRPLLSANWNGNILQIFHHDKSETWRKLWFPTIWKIKT